MKQEQKQKNQKLRRKDLTPSEQLQRRGLEFPVKDKMLKRGQVTK